LPRQIILTLLQKHIRQRDLKEFLDELVTLMQPLRLEKVLR